MKRSRRRLFINLALFCVVAALSVFAWKGGEKKTPPSYPLSSLAPSQVKRLQLQRPGGRALVLEKENTGWFIAEPFHARASDNLADEILGLLTAKATERYPAEGLERYGLATPQAILTLGTQAFSIGDMHPFKPEQYVETEGFVYLVSSRYGLAAATRTDDFLTRRILAEDEEPLSFRLADGAAFQRDEKGNWSGGENDKLNAFAQLWQQTYAASTEQGFHASGPHIDIGLKNGKSIRVIVAATTPDVVLVRSDEGLAFHYPEAAGKKLLAP